MEAPPAARPAITTNLRGDIGEVWRDGEQLGLVYQWTVHGTNGKWEGDALKYRLTGGEGGGVVFRLFIVAPGVQMEINACGHLVGLLNADGELQKQPVKLKGTRIEVA